MTLRTVTGTVNHQDGTPYINMKLQFDLLEDVISSGKLYPIGTYIVRTDAGGTFSIDLVVPDTGSASYQVTIPDIAGTTYYRTNQVETYPFYLAAGISIDLSTLLALPLAPTIVDPLQTLLNAHVAAHDPHLGMFLNVKSYGAVGDGVTDDTVAIQAAFDSFAIGSVGWGIYFPSGTYYVTSSIILPGAIAVQKQVPFYIQGAGAKLYTDKPITIFKRWPPNEAAANSFTLVSFIIDGLMFQGTSLRSQIGLDLACTYGAKISNCYYWALGIGMRLSYGLMCEVIGCFGRACIIANFVSSDGYPFWSASHFWATVNTTYRSCHVYSSAATRVAIQGLSKASLCVVTWVAHGLSDDDIVYIDGITQADWTPLNKRRFQITKITDDSFSLQVMDRTNGGADMDTSAYTLDYVPATDPGVIQAAVFGFMEFETYGNILQSCITEGSALTDNVFFYHFTVGSSLSIINHYVENTPWGSSLYLNFVGGKVTLNRFGSNYGAIVVDAYDMATNASGVIEARDYNKGTGLRQIRIPKDTSSSTLIWIFSTGTSLGYGLNMLDPQYWYDPVNPTGPTYTVLPYRIINTVYSSGSWIQQGTQVVLQGGQGVYVKQEVNYPVVYSVYAGASYRGLQVEANALGGGGVAAYDITNGQAIYMRQMTTETDITAGAYFDLVGFLPNGSMVVGLTARVTEAIIGAGTVTSFDVGVVGDTDLWLNDVSVNLGTTGDLSKATATSPMRYSAATDVRITANGGGTFQGGAGKGKIRLTVHYFELTPPGS